MTILRPFLIALAALTALLAVPSAAGAYALLGGSWPTRTITYATTGATQYDGTVRAAARIWNRADVGVRFREVGADAAEVTVDYGGVRCQGYTDVRFGRRYAFAEVSLGRGCDKRLMRLVAVHELGHVLGLDHERRRCARMNPTFDQHGTPTSCAPRTLSAWLRHPLLPDDLRGARSIYR